MFNRVIVPLDGTTFAEASLTPTREVAKRFGSRVLVVRAVPPIGGVGDATSEGRQCELERLDEADAYLHGVVADLRDEGIDADLLVYAASPDGAIALVAELKNADLVIMATHMRNADDVASSGTTLRLLDESAVPILVWHGHPVARPAHPERDARIHRPLAGPNTPIVVPLDGTPFAERTLPVAVELARALGASLVLARAVRTAGDPFQYVGAAFTPDDYDMADRMTVSHLRRADDAREYLARLSDDTQKRGIRTHTAIRSGAPTAMMASVCREHHAGLIVMATHSHAWPLGRLLNSVATHVVEEVETPILVLRPEGASRSPHGQASERPMWQPTAAYSGGI